MNKEIMQQALTILKAWDALIKYQYGGSSEAMTAMQNVAWRTLDTIEGLEAALAQPEADLFWVSNDPETGYDSIEELISSYDVGDELKILRAKVLEPITIRITQKNDEDYDYEIVEVTK
jgi:hypothetical protein